jgi:hypothetical protein
VIHILHVKAQKTEIIHIRCTPETKKLWLNILYEFKKKGYTAEDVLAYALQLLLEKNKYSTSGFTF